MSAIVTELLIIGVLLILNGIFSMSELAIVASKRVRLERQAERGSAGAKAALALTAHPGDFLSTVQVGITLVGVIASVYGGATIAEMLAEQLVAVPWLGEHAEAVSLVIVVAGITYLSVIIGELVPKRIALGNPERVAALVARPMQALSRIGAPLVRILTGSTQLLLGAFGIKGVPEPGLTEEEIHAVVEQGAEAGVVPEVEHQIVENVFRLGDRRVASVMTPRADVPWISPGATAAEIRGAVLQSGADWILVCDGDIETVRGLASARELLTQVLGGGALSVEATMDAPLFVPSTTPVFQMLKQFRDSRNHVAIVLDEFGGVEGVVSLDHIVADLVGTSSSDPDGAPPELIHRADGSWSAEGELEMEAIRESLDLPADPNAESRLYRTLSGFLMGRLGRVPAAGDSVLADHHEFTVETMEGRRVGRVRIARITAPGTRAAEGGPQVG